jgi:hypothetical protein
MLVTLAQRGVSRWMGAEMLRCARVTSIGQPCISIADSLSRWYTLGSIKGVLTTPVTLQGRAETGTEEGCE